MPHVLTAISHTEVRVSPTDEDGVDFALIFDRSFRYRRIEGLLRACCV
jgi:hypothetical protein